MGNTRRGIPGNRKGYRQANPAALRRRRLRLAISYLGNAIEASRKIKQLDNIIEFSQYLSDAYLLAGELHKDALVSYKQYTVR